MRMYVGKKRKKYIFLFVPLIIFVWVILRLGPVYMEHAASYVYSHANVVLNDSIGNYCKNIEYNDFVKLCYDSQGRVTSVESDSAAVNRFKSQITSEIERVMLNEVDGYVYIPLGSVLSLPIFSDFGPKLKFKVYPVGRAEINISGGFDDAGINQVCHSLYLDAKITYGITNAAFTHNETVNTKYLIGETVIVGDVPRVYGGNAIMQEDNFDE